MIIFTQYFEYKWTSLQMSAKKTLLAMADPYACLEKFQTFFVIHSLARTRGFNLVHTVHTYWFENGNYSTQLMPNNKQIIFQCFFTFFIISFRL